MSIYTEYRATTALGIDQDGNRQRQSPDDGHWRTDEQEAREIYADLVGGPSDRLTALMSRQVTPWVPVNGPIAPAGNLMPAYRAELWVPRTRGGQPERSRVTTPKATYAAAEALKDIAHHHGDRGWRVYARLQSPITILEQRGAAQLVMGTDGDIYNLAKETP